MLVNSTFFMRNCLIFMQSRISIHKCGLNLVTPQWPCLFYAEMFHYPVDNFGTVVGENPDCLLLSGTVVGENPDHVCWVAGALGTHCKG